MCCPKDLSLFFISVLSQEQLGTHFLACCRAGDHRNYLLRNHG
uniref:Uncharacterized protein n=1 Tax=Arundo donax TaxID=35708 RepID=A0A0A8YU40_ARUDO